MIHTVNSSNLFPAKFLFGTRFDGKQQQQQQKDFDHDHQDDSNLNQKS